MKEWRERGAQGLRERELHFSRREGGESLNIIGDQSPPALSYCMKMMTLALEKQQSKQVQNKETTKEETCRKGRNSRKGAGEERRRDLKIFSSKNMRILYHKQHKGKKE